MGLASLGDHRRGHGEWVLKHGTVIHVYIKAASEKSPGDDTWTHTLISRRPNIPHTQAETRKTHAVLNVVRKEFDIIPD